MSKSVKARVCWVTAEAGGRKCPPPGPKYVTVARFEDDRKNWPEKAWSLVVEFTRVRDESEKPGCVIADVRFLAPDGPRSLLYHGSVFELFEGRRVVARGEVP